MRPLLAFLLLTTFAHAAELHQKTKEGFDHYMKVTEARVHSELTAAAQGKPFLNFEMKDAAQQRLVRDQLSRGETVIEKVVDKENGKSIDDIPDGMIHHWRATVFIPKADLKSTLALI